MSKTFLVSISFGTLLHIVNNNMTIYNLILCCVHIPVYQTYTNILEVKYKPSFFSAPGFKWIIC